MSDRSWGVELEKRMGSWIGITRETSFMPLRKTIQMVPGPAGFTANDVRGVMRDALTGIAVVTVPSEIVIQWIIESEKKASEILATAVGLGDKTNTE